MAELVHLPLVAATDTSIIATTNPKPRFASRNNSIDPPANLLPNNNNNNNNNLSINNSVDPPTNLLPNNNNNNISRNNSIDPPSILPNNNNLSRNNSNVTENKNPENPKLPLHINNRSRESAKQLDHRILLGQMIRRNNGNENQVRTSEENQITLQNLIKASLLKSDSLSKMNPNRCVELRGFGNGVPIQQG